MENAPLYFNMFVKVLILFQFQHGEPTEKVLIKHLIKPF
jgi:hypothetical protein